MAKAEVATVTPPTMTEQLDEQFNKVASMKEEKFIRILQLMQSNVITQVEARQALGLNVTRQQRRNS